MNKTVLHWSYRDFEHVPLELLYYDEYLEEIYLKENFIKTIPIWLFQIKNLKFIHLSGNLIEFIPSDINELVNLEFLDLSGNLIVELPTTIGYITNLQTLNLSGNRIEILPKSIGLLKQLEFLDLSDNLIRKLPIELCECSRLNNFSINDNPNLLHIPERVANLSTLQTLSADRCGLLCLPAIVNKFINQVQMFHNPSLTHMPMIYANFFGNNFHGTNAGVVSQPPNNEQPTYTNNPRCFLVREKESEKILLLPIGTRKIFPLDYAENQIPLYDDALRVLNYINLSTLIYNNIKFFKYLPNKAMANHIRNGPIARCTSRKCSSPLYTTYYFGVFKRKNSTSKMLFSCFFCSKFCSNIWLIENKTKYTSLDWEICDN